MTYNVNMKKLNVVVETRPFIQAVAKFWTVDDLLDFKTFIAGNYEKGDLIQGTGGIRKIRWTRRGIGKRGGIRVIYFYYDETAPIYLLLAYPKNVSDDLSSEDKKALSAVTAKIKAALQKKRVTT